MGPERAQRLAAAWPSRGWSFQSCLKNRPALFVCYHSRKEQKVFIPEIPNKTRAEITVDTRIIKKFRVVLQYDIVLLTKLKESWPLFCVEVSLWHVLSVENELVLTGINLNFERHLPQRLELPAHASNFVRRRRWENFWWFFPWIRPHKIASPPPQTFNWLLPITETWMKRWEKVRADAFQT